MKGDEQGGIRIKTFQANSLAEALECVRREFGPDALVLDTQTTRPPRWRPLHWLGASRWRAASRSVAVTASSGRARESLVSALPVTHATELSEEAVLDESSVPASAPGSRPFPRRSLVAGLEVSRDASTARDADCDSLGMERQPAAYRMLEQQLTETDLPSFRVQRWLEAAKRELGPGVSDPWVLRQLLASWIRAEIRIDPPSHAWVESPSVVAVVGASGHGKTTSVAKIAAHAAFARDLRPAVVRLESKSCSSNDSLARICEWMQWKCVAIDPMSAPREWNGLLPSLGESDFLVIDTPAATFGDREVRESLVSALNTLSVTQTHLVVPAYASERHVDRLREWYQPLQPSHWLISKLDEAAGMSGLFHALTRHDLPLGLASTGTRVPDDWIEWDGASLAKSVLGE